MRKSLIALVAFATVGMTLQSCGSRMTDEQIEAKAKETFEAKKTELQKKADDDCTTLRATRVNAVRDSIINANVTPAPTGK